MPSLDRYKQIVGSHSIGEVHKIESDKIMNATWWNDINSRVGYLYDWYHDDNKTQLNGMNPETDLNKIPIDIKFLQHTSQTYSKDYVTFHIQLRPHQECNVPYYNEFFKDRYNSEYPIGLYCDIPDERGVYNRWLVVDKANFNVTQFPTFEILRCDRVIQYMYNGRKYNVPGVLRSQNSYNSGVWRDYKIESIEDQQKFCIPMNRDTEVLYYNQRLIIDGFVLTEPRAWRITKINRYSPNGIAMVTTAQDFFDQNHDYIELDKDNKVIGMWADFFQSDNMGQDEPSDSQIHAEITYSGTNPNIKIGGSFKKFTVKFYDGDNEVDFIPGTWSYYIDDVDASNLIEESTISIDENQIKVKFIGGDDYIGKTLVVKYDTGTIRCSLNALLIAL